MSVQTEIEKVVNEIITEPYVGYLAPVGTVMPELSAGDPSSETWTKLGTSGDESYAEAGVTVTHTQTVSTVQGAGSTEVNKPWRGEEKTEVAFEVMSLSPEQYATIFEATLKTIAAPSESKKGLYGFGLHRGIKVKLHALLLRGPSALAEGLESQYYLPAVYQAANQAPKYAIKGGPAYLAVQYTTMRVPNASPDTPGTEPELQIEAPEEEAS